MRRLLPLSVLVVAFGVVPSASADLRLINVTSPVHRRGIETLSVFSTSVCSIRVHYRTRAPIIAPGLYTKGPLLGFIRWSWAIDARATPGRWSIDLACGQESLHTSFVVLR
jgi:hypothetical protein